MRVEIFIESEGLVVIQCTVDKISIVEDCGMLQCWIDRDKHIQETLKCHEKGFFNRSVLKSTHAVTKNVQMFVLIAATV